MILFSFLENPTDIS